MIDDNYHYERLDYEQNISCIATTSEFHKQYNRDRAVNIIRSSQIMDKVTITDVRNIFMIVLQLKLISVGSFV